MFRKAITLALCAMLAGCTTTAGLLPPDTLYPDALTMCQPDPLVPGKAGDSLDDKTVATYIVGLHAAGQDCRDTVAATAQRKKLYEDQFNAQTKDFFERSVDALNVVLPF